MADAAKPGHEQEASKCYGPTFDAVDHARSQVLASPVIKGPNICRPKAIGLAEQFDADAAGVPEMQRLRSQYGRAPAQIRIVPGRKLAPLLDQKMSIGYSTTPRCHVAVGTQ